MDTSRGWEIQPAGWVLLIVLAILVIRAIVNSRGTEDHSKSMDLPKLIF
jgi:hypothetical protein